MAREIADADGAVIRDLSGENYGELAPNQRLLLYLRHSPNIDSEYVDTMAAMARQNDPSFNLNTIVHVGALAMQPVMALQENTKANGAKEYLSTKLTGKQLAEGIINNHEMDDSERKSQLREILKAANLTNIELQSLVELNDEKKEEMTEVRSFKPLVGNYMKRPNGTRPADDPKVDPIAMKAPTQPRVVKAETATPGPTAPLLTRRTSAKKTRSRARGLSMEVEQFNNVELTTLMGGHKYGIAVEYLSRHAAGLETDARQLAIKTLVECAQTQEKKVQLAGICMTKLNDKGDLKKEILNEARTQAKKAVTDSRAHTKGSRAEKTAKNSVSSAIAKAGGEKKSVLKKAEKEQGGFRM